MARVVVVPPTVEPVELAAVKHRLRIDGSADDDLLSALITSAREMAEHETGRALAEQTIDVVLDAFPCDGIRLMAVPAVSLVELAYLDAAGVQQTFDLNDLVLDSVSEPSWVLPEAGMSWPATAESINAVRLRYVAGYAAGQCPQSIVTWIIAMVGHWYKNRETVAAGTMTRVDYYDTLLDRWKVYA